MSNTMTSGTNTTSRTETIKQAVANKLRQIGKADTPTNRLEVAAFLGYRKDYLKLLEQERKDSQNQRTLSDREARRTDNQTDVEKAQGKEWAAKHKVIIGNGAGESSLEFCISAAKAEYETEMADLAEVKAEGFRQQAMYEAGERQRISRLFKYPYAGKYKNLFEQADRLDDKTADGLAAYSMIDLANAVNFARSQAEDSLLTRFTSEETAQIKAFILLNDLLATKESSWAAGFAVLKAEGAIRAEALPSHVIKFEEPKLPTVESKSSEPTNPYKVGTPDYEHYERVTRQNSIFDDVMREIGSYLTEITQASGLSIPASLCIEVHDTLRNQRLETNRENTRKVFWQLRKNEHPRPWWTEDELASWTVDVEMERNMSSDDLKKRIYQYGR